MLSLYQAMDRMKKRYGFDVVARCAGATLKVKANNVHQLSLLSQPSLWHYSFKRISTTSRRGVLWH
jgi:hypothetical protein